MSAEVIQFRAPTTSTGLAIAERERRLQLTQGREHLLSDLRPHITRDDLTLGAVAAYFRIQPTALAELCGTYRTELAEVGYWPDAGFTRRAILHVALLLPLKVSERADVLKRALGEWSARQPATAAAVIPNHERWCRGLLNTAAELAEDAQDGDPSALWSAVSCLGRHELQGVAVALAAMLPLDQAGLRQHLSQIGLTALRDAEEPAHPSRAAAAGLATLVPEPKAGA